MKNDTFRYDFTINELVYFLFKKKICPRCGSKMEKNKCCETIDGSVFNTNSVPLYIQGSQVKRYFYVFVCRECGYEFKLNNLSK